MTERVNTSVGRLLHTDGAGGRDAITWNWLADRALTEALEHDDAIWWYTRSGIRGVAAYPQDREYVEVFWTPPGVYVFRRKNPDDYLVSGVLEPSSVGVHNIAEALKEGKVLQLVPRALISADPEG